MEVDLEGDGYEFSEDRGREHCPAIELEPNPRAARASLAARIAPAAHGGGASPSKSLYRSDS